MNKTAKSLLIPIAAFAVTATGVSAFNSDILEKAGLSSEQIAAFETAHELKTEGEKDAAREVLKAAGVDFATMQAIRAAHQEERGAHREAIAEAVKNNDYDSFIAAIEGSPLADIVNTEADFAQFVEAHTLRTQAQEILSELGVKTGEAGYGRQGGGHHGLMFGHDDFEE